MREAQAREARHGAAQCNAMRQVPRRRVVSRRGKRCGEMRVRAARVCGACIHMGAIYIYTHINMYIILI